MKLFQQNDIHDLLEAIYYQKEILLSNWMKADYMTEDKHYIIFMPFIDTEKHYKLNIFYNNNQKTNRKIDILTFKENIPKINEILNITTNIIEIDSLVKELYEENKGT